jgi:hypothetical protein
MVGGGGNSNRPEEESQLHVGNCRHTTSGFSSFSSYHHKDDSLK